MTTLVSIFTPPVCFYLLFLVVLSIFILYRMYETDSKFPSFILLIYIPLCTLLVGSFLGCLFYLSGAEVLEMSRKAPPGEWDILDWGKGIGLCFVMFLFGLIGLTLSLFVFFGKLPGIVKKLWKGFFWSFLLPILALLFFCFGMLLFHLCALSVISPGQNELGTGVMIILFVLGSGIMLAFVGLAYTVVGSGNRELKKYEDKVKGRTFRKLTILCLVLWQGMAMAGDCEAWTVETVPNPKQEDARHFVSDPDGILSSGAVDEINGMLAQLEDSLTIEVAVVALSSIGEDDPDDFAFRLFSEWGVGKRADDNGLLILLTLDQRQITFKTGYGLEGVLPDATCYRIQQDAMFPYLAIDNFDQGMVEGVRAVSLKLYGSEYTAAGLRSKLLNPFNQLPRKDRALLVCIFALMNGFTCWLLSRKYRPEDLTPQSAIEILLLRKQLSLVGFLKAVWLVPLWPALLLFILWYFGFQRQRIRLKAHTCPRCDAFTLEEESNEVVNAYLSPAEMIEKRIGSVLYKRYRCASCGEELVYKLELAKGYERCPDCQHLTLKPTKKEQTLKDASYTAPGLSEREHQCLSCGAAYAVQTELPKLEHSSSSTGSHGHSGGGGSSRSGGSFGGGRSGGGGSSSRF